MPAAEVTGDLSSPSTTDFILCTMSFNPWILFISQFSVGKQKCRNYLHEIKLLYES